jgi:hypothetical protein
LIVDTSIEQAAPRTTADEGVERVLSCAASVIPEWLHRNIRLQMFIASESPDELNTESVSSSVTDVEPLLIRLAAASVMDEKLGDERLLQMVECAGNKPVMILTSRSQLPMVLSSRPRCQIVCCKATAIESPSPTKSDASKFRRVLLELT